MAYNTKQMLKDATGKNFIPQYWDEDANMYRPLSDPRKITSLDGVTINATIGDQQSKTGNVTLQDTVTVAGVGTPFVVGAYKTLTIEITGTSTSQTIKFEGSSVSGTYYEIMGVKLQDLSMATQTTGINEVWTFEVTGLVSFRVNITTISGGSISVRGKAVA